jgi:hypothetical protein
MNDVAFLESVLEFITFIYGLNYHEAGYES